jgi:hypothetical protein
MAISSPKKSRGVTTKEILLNPDFVIPAKAGIQLHQSFLDARLRKRAGSFFFL